MSDQDTIDKPRYSNMDEMLDYFESRGEKLDALDLSSITNYMENNFVSKVTFGGVPILPPMMTTKRRQEMMMYKRQACISETRLKSSKREKIAKRAQSFVEDIQNISGLQQSSSSSSSGNKLLGEEETITQAVTKTQLLSNQKEDISSFKDTSDVKSKLVSDRLDVRHTVTEDTGISTSSSVQYDGLLTESALGSLRLESGPAGEPGIPSFLESLSDYQSLEEMGISLPTEYDGHPLTSTKQKQISQLLAKLSRDLNIKDSLTSTSSSANSGHSAGEPMSTHSTSQYSMMGSNGGLYLNVDDTIRDTSQDTLPELITTDEHLANESASTIKSVTSGHTNDELSADDKSLDSIRSPKSLKNTVHFASTVTEIYTDNKSGESSTLQKSLQSPASTPRSSAASLTQGPSAETLLRHLKARRKEMLSSETKQENCPPVSQYIAVSGVNNSASDTAISTADSLLSKVVLSPELESSSSSSKDTQFSGGKPNVPFQSYAIEGETSDKENEYRIGEELHSSPRSNKPVDGTENLKNSTESAETQSEVNILGEFHHEKSSGEFHTGSPASRPDSNLSRVSLHSLTTSTDADTLCGQDSLQSTIVPSQNTGDSVSTIRTSDYYQEENEDPLSPDHCDTVIRVRTAPSMNIPVEGHDQSNSNELGAKEKNRHSKKNHTRKGSYTLEEPSPALVRACSKINVSNEDKSPQPHLTEDSPTIPAAGVQSKAVTDTKAVQPSDNDQSSHCIKRQLDYCELDEEPTEVPHGGQVELEAECEGKQEHLNRYLDCVRQQSEEREQFTQVALRNTVQPTSQKQTSNPDFLDSYTQSSLSSFSLDQGKASHMSQEELFDMQATHFDVLRKTLVEQQQQQLEHLFVQQQQEQLLLQREIEERCRLITEHQEFLGDQVSSSNQGRLPQSTGERKSVQVSKSSDPSLTQPGSSYSYISSPSLAKHPSDKDNSFVSTFSRTTPKQSLFGSSPPQPANHQPAYHQQNKPVLRSPRRAPPPRSNRRLVVPDKVGEAGMKPYFDRVSAGVKGYLTRRLLRTEKVQNLIKTVQDTRDFAVNFQSETPIKQGKFSMQDRDLLERIIAQLQAALLDIHEVFFEISTAERMAMISASRQLEMERRFKELEQSVTRSHPRISMATLKAIERKKRAQAAEESVFGTNRPQSAPPPQTSSPKQVKNIDHRALRPLQGHISPIQGSQEETRSRQNKDRPRTAPDRVTVVNTHRAASKGRKPIVMGAQGTEHRRPSKSLLVKAKPVSSTATATVTATKPGKTKSGKVWR